MLDSLPEISVFLCHNWQEDRNLLPSAVHGMARTEKAKFTTSPKFLPETDRARLPDVFDSAGFGTIEVRVPRSAENFSPLVHGVRDGDIGRNGRSETR